MSLLSRLVALTPSPEIPLEGFGELPITGIQLREAVGYLEILVEVAPDAATRTGARLLINALRNRLRAQGFRVDALPFQTALKDEINHGEETKSKDQ